MRLPSGLNATGPDAHWRWICFCPVSVEPNILRGQVHESLTAFGQRRWTLSATIPTPRNAARIVAACEASFRLLKARTSFLAESVDGTPPASADGPSPVSAGCPLSCVLAPPLFLHRPWL